MEKNFEVILMTSFGDVILMTSSKLLHNCFLFRINLQAHNSVKSRNFAHPRHKKSKLSDIFTNVVVPSQT